MVTQNTLPLFPGWAPIPAGQGNDAAAAGPVKLAAVVQVRARMHRRDVTISPHLIEARRLSRRMRALKDRADVQTVTGRAICQHLRLLLQESERPTDH